MNLTKKELTELSLKIYNDISSGLFYTHTRINANTTKTLEASSFLYALIELLNEKGLISIEELDERKKQVAERLVNNFVKTGIGLMFQDPECDKYTFEHVADVDCESRLHICKGICCKLPFALSRQDVEERIIHWEFGRPYLISHGADGYCTHLDRETLLCTIREHRSVACRGFDCRDNERWKVWLDYDNMIINPELMDKVEKDNLRIYHQGNQVKQKGVEINGSIG